VADHPLTGSGQSAAKSSASFSFAHEWCGVKTGSSRSPCDQRLESAKIELVPIKPSGKRELTRNAEAFTRSVTINEKRRYTQGSLVTVVDCLCSSGDALRGAHSLLRDGSFFNMLFRPFGYLTKAKGEGAC